MSHSVRVYRSTDNGASGVTGEANSLIANVLDPCLVNGYGQITLDSLVVSSNVVTATKNPHNFTALGTTGPVIRIAGATPSGLNGDWRVTITSPSTFTFTTAGIADGAATGTITAKRAPAGFTKPFSDTNIAVYQSGNSEGNQHYLRVADAGVGSPKYARVIGYETMTTDVNGGANPFPTEAQQAGGGYWNKSSTADSVAKAWCLVADADAFYLFIDQVISSQTVGMYFGDSVSGHPGDVFGTLLNVHTGANTGYSLQNLGASSAAGHFMPRSYTQKLGTSISPLKYGHFLATSAMGTTGATYPHPGNSRFYCTDVQIWESSTLLRGKMPGLYAPVHPAANFTHLSVLASDVGIPGRELLVLRIYNNAACMLDITGPWR